MVSCGAGLAVCAFSPLHGADRAVHVSVAVSLQPVLRQAAEAYRERQAEDVLLNSGASGVLLQQARRGAPVDLLISASPDEIDQLVREQLARPETRRRIASNRLVVVVPPGERPPQEARDLAAAEYDRIAMGNPRTAPVGRYGAQVLRGLGLWDRLEPRLVFAENARQVLEYVARGEVSAGLVYRTDALLLERRVARGPDIGGQSHETILYEGVVLRNAGRAQAAEELLRWLVSDDGRLALERHGFLPPP